MERVVGDVAGRHGVLDGKRRTASYGTGNQSFKSGGRGTRSVKRYFLAWTAKNTPDPASANTTAAANANIQVGLASKSPGNFESSAADSEGASGGATIGSTKGALVGIGVSMDAAALAASEAAGRVASGAVDSLPEVVAGGVVIRSAGTRF